MIILLTLAEDADDHLRCLAGTARLYSDPQRVRVLVAARSAGELLDIVRAGTRNANDFPPV